VRRRTPLLVCLVACGAGCGGHESASVRLPNGFTLRTVKEPALSIALPRSWRSVGAGERAEGAGLRLQREALTGSNPPMKLLAFDRRAPANMNVLQTRVPPSLTFDEFRRREARQLKAAKKLTNLRQSIAHLPAGSALHLAYRMGGLALDQYFVLHGKFMYVLTYVTDSEDAPRYKRIFDQSAHTFQLR
jgi:hypothetical protein